MDFLFESFIWVHIIAPLSIVVLLVVGAVGGIVLLFLLGSFLFFLGRAVYYGLTSTGDDFHKILDVLLSPNSPEFAVIYPSHRAVNRIFLDLNGFSQGRIHFLVTTLSGLGYLRTWTYAGVDYVSVGKENYDLTVALSESLKGEKKFRKIFKASLEAKRSKVRGGRTKL